MSEKVVLYALKSNGSFIRITAQGLELVSMQKASVYGSLDDLGIALATVGEAAKQQVGELRAVSLTIEEQEVELP